MSNTTKILLAAGSGGCLILLCGGLVAAFFGMSVLSAIAIPNFVGMQQKAKRAELPGNVAGIAQAELAYDAAFDEFVAVGSRAVALEAVLYQGKEPVERDWGGAWQTLGWRADGPVRGAYWVEATSTTFEVHGLADIDEDGVPCEYVYTHPGGYTELVTGAYTY